LNYEWRPWEGVWKRRIRKINEEDRGIDVDRMMCEKLDRRRRER
jgi:hypothetical protein